MVAALLISGCAVTYGTKTGDLGIYPGLAPSDDVQTAARPCVPTTSPPTATYPGPPAVTASIVPRTKASP